MAQRRPARCFTAMIFRLANAHEPLAAHAMGWLLQREAAPAVLGSVLSGAASGLCALLGSAASPHSSCRPRGTRGVWVAGRGEGLRTDQPVIWRGVLSAACLSPLTLTAWLCMEAPLAAPSYYGSLLIRVTGAVVPQRMPHAQQGSALQSETTGSMSPAPRDDYRSRGAQTRALLVPCTWLSPASRESAAGSDFEAAVPLRLTRPALVQLGLTAALSTSEPSPLPRGVLVALQLQLVQRWSLRAELLGNVHLSICESGFICACNCNGACNGPDTAARNEEDFVSLSDVRTVYVMLI